MGVLDAPPSVRGVPTLQQRLYALAGVGGQVASNRMVSATTSIANTPVTVRIARKMVNGASVIRFVYANITKSGTGEDPNNSGIHVKPAIEYPVGSIVPVLFGGKKVASIAPGGIAVSDPISVMVAAGDTIYERNTVAPPMPPSLTATAVTGTGNLPAATYFYKVTSVTDAGESASSAEASATLGSTGRVVLLIGDKNLSGIDVKRYNIYRSTSTGTELLVGSVPGSLRQFTDDNSLTTPATTLSQAISSSRVANVASTAGIKPGDLITIAVAGDFTVDFVVSDTQLWLTTSTSASNGAAVTLKVQAPTTALNIPVNHFTYTNLDANEGYGQNSDLVYGTSSGIAYTSSTGQTKAHAAFAVLAQPSPSVTSPKPSIALLGDSIMNGTGWVATTAPYRGFGAYALGENFPFISPSVGGESAYQIADSTHSNVRMSVVGACTYSVSEYGTNDAGAGKTTTQTKAALVTIAQRCIRAGVKKHWQTTILPKPGSTDGWQTLANQSPGGANETQRQAINQWLRAPASAGAGNSFLADVGATYAPYVAVFDIALIAERNSDASTLTINGTTGAISNGTGGYWKVYGTTQYDTNSGTVSGTTTTVADSGKAWTTNQYAGYMVAVTTSGTTTYIEITSNTATTLTVNGTIPAPSGASTYFIYKSPTIDGTHPTDFMHQELAAAIDTTQFV